MGSRRVALTLAVLTAGCAGSGPSTQVELVQEVMSLQVTFAESCPPQVVADLFVGYGACSELLSPPAIQRLGDSIVIRVQVETRVDAVCPAILYGKQLSVPLGSDFVAGRDYRVVAPSRSTATGEATFSYPACAL